VQRVVLAVVAIVCCAACSDDDDSSAVVVTTTTTPAATAGIAPPAATAPPMTLAPPAGLDQLAAGLLAADEVGVPAAWTIRDVDPAIMDADMAALADPLQGLATCPDGALRPGSGWLQRTFSGAEPLDTGMLRVDLLLAVQDDAGFAAQRAALASCASGEESTLEVAAGTVTPLDGVPLAPVGPPVEATTLLLSAGPTADVPYPSSYALVTANRGGRTITAVVGGVDLGVPFDETTRELVGRLLARL
jgi:hypothetical protein